MTTPNQTQGRRERISRPDPEALEDAARLVMKLCFTPQFQWSFKSFNGIPMGISARQRAAVRKLAAFLPEYDHVSGAHNEV